MKAFLILLFLVPIMGHACLWYHGTTIDGKPPATGGSGVYRVKASMEATAEEKIKSLLMNGDLSTPEETVALQEIANGNYAAAIAILEFIESEKPNRYSVAANLGTAYELNGNLDLALKWINESMKRNPASHYGTEWLHVEILKEKIRMRDGDGQSDLSDFLVVPESFDSDYQIQVSGNAYTPKEVAKALSYQLNERVVFVKPKDPIVAALLFDYAMIEANTRYLESSIELLDLASQYGYPDVALIERKKSEFQQQIDAAK